ncbi:hypothetical protein MMC14_005705 [Varicellaria rhodocarpa]|nr:hypothetical protein [Varicellaria rhodocarpa]
MDSTVPQSHQRLSVIKPKSFGDDLSVAIKTSKPRPNLLINSHIRPHQPPPPPPSPVGFPDFLGVELIRRRSSIPTR